MSDSKFILLGQEIKKGKRTVLDLDVARLHTRNSLRIPIIVERSLHDGPVLLLLGGVHGDETNGVAIVREIIRKKYNKPKRGTVICIPVFNIFGYLNQSREFPDGRDLNRMFPGTASGSLASQFAHKFSKEIAPFVDYVLDFHTGSAGRENFSNVRCVLKQTESFELAKVFGAPYIVNSTYIPKSIRESFNKKGKTILLFEGGKALELDQSVIDCGVNGAMNIMKHLGMQEGEVKVGKAPTIIEKSKWLRAPDSGMFKSLVKNGSQVKYKEVIAKVFDPFGEFEKNVLAPFDCYIFGMNTSPIVYKGDAIFHVSEETK
ncbi:succinylglutamate desuccinylase/aspartoacylase family protein [Lentimicrobium sp. S6]|uniref:succinylglutamate desuccinylase/aspartoacylase family protein n=1 Tax=Lentimicrobium sp. S6 TaxID=2735872 RepID=UPI001552AD5F|nr:succinylglutamate desuccinylase/aspartoacylase family protein [Lentimicrobium sp. S6]NPD46974.1 succinylglutamate desuccinylase/aspartoacylase family protein [Lentimicrobium sp. S6]